MALTESTEVRQIEIAYVQGVPANVYRETKSYVLKDGVILAENTHREPVAANSPEMQAVFGDALADALTQVQALTAQVAEDNRTIDTLLGASATDQGTIAILRGQAQRLTEELAAAQALLQGEVQRLTEELAAARALLGQG